MLKQQRLPNINVIQDSPTSPGQAPHRAFTAPRDRQVNVDGAPEVDRTWREVEGLQVDPNGPYPQPTTGVGARPEKYVLSLPSSNEKQVSHDDAGLLSVEHESRRDAQERRICGLKKRTFIIVAAIIATFVIVAAVGGAVGGYYANKTDTTPTKTTGSMTSGTTSPMNLGTTGPVTSGTTGMASLPCSPNPATSTNPSAPRFVPRDIPNPYLTIGATFSITCRRGVRGSKDRRGRFIDNIGIYTMYNFSSCMDKCAEKLDCGGVTYSANLTDMLADGDPGGNCLLKNGTFDAVAPRAPWFASGVKE
ncbi:hypothetical protein CC78DRAFT_532122 [Lojkania enalia]|uniref:Apple domain-containing protein n=1 Tax=Lojkania enalia TaxID=147567 RepID=A0A9P4KAM6_9PLEO|nr:hypothetical protein CC78DRAFT_532122 [Didymosphaeria enalia]